MQLFYNSNIDENTSEFFFPKEESKHIVKVLRKSVGDVLNITNGLGYHFTSEITIANQNKCVSKIISKTLKTKRNFKLHLAVAPTKMNDRYEWFLEKATEIGIETITPIICDNSERKIIKKERFERILQSAMKQSLSCYLPKLNDVISFSDFINQDFSGDLYIAHCEKTKKKSLKNIIKPNTDITILIGPEGDFSKKEIEYAKTNKFIPVTMGNKRLRTETAAIAAAVFVDFVNQL